jgi:hypothetical protein
MQSASREAAIGQLRSLNEGSEHNLKWLFHTESGHSSAALRRLQSVLCGLTYYSKR